MPCQTDQDGRNWIAAIDVSSVPDARAELEDGEGKALPAVRRAACQRFGPVRQLTDPFGPGESFSVFLPFRLPRGETPAGLVLPR